MSGFKIRPLKPSVMFSDWRLACKRFWGSEPSGRLRSRQHVYYKYIFDAVCRASRGREREKGEGRAEEGDTHTHTLRALRASSPVSVCSQSAGTIERIVQPAGPCVPAPSSIPERGDRCIPPSHAQPCHTPSCRHTCTHTLQLAQGDYTPIQPSHAPFDFNPVLDFNLKLPWITFCSVVYSHQHRAVYFSWNRKQKFFCFFSAIWTVCLRGSVL